MTETTTHHPVIERFKDELAGEEASKPTDESPDNHGIWMNPEKTIALVPDGNTSLHRLDINTFDTEPTHITWVASDEYAENAPNKNVFVVTDTDDPTTYDTTVESYNQRYIGATEEVKLTKDDTAHMIDAELVTQVLNFLNLDSVNELKPLTRTCMSKGDAYPIQVDIPDEPFTILVMCRTDDVGWIQPTRV